MKKLVIASASAIALFGLAACSDTDETTTQSLDPIEETQPVQPAEPMMAPPADETPENGTSADEIRPVE